MRRSSDEPLPASSVWNLDALRREFEVAKEGWTDMCSEPGWCDVVADFKAHELYKQDMCLAEYRFQAGNPFVFPEFEEWVTEILRTG